jgi:hypothetical protein
VSFWAAEVLLAPLTPTVEPVVMHVIVGKAVWEGSVLPSAPLANRCAAASALPPSGLTILAVGVASDCGGFLTLPALPDAECPNNTNRVPGETGDGYECVSVPWERVVSVALMTPNPMLKNASKSNR